MRLALVAFIVITIPLLTGCVVESAALSVPAPDQMTGKSTACSALDNEGALRDELLRLVNLERQKVGLTKLVGNDVLTDQATQYASEMIEYDFFVIKASIP